MATQIPKICVQSLEQKISGTAGCILCNRNWVEPNIFYQVSSLSSHYCPIHIAICFQIQLQLLSGGVSAYHTVVTSTSWQQFILLFGGSDSPVPSSSQWIRVLHFCSVFLTHHFVQVWWLLLPLMSACSRAPPNTFVICCSVPHLGKVAIE